MKYTNHYRTRTKKVAETPQSQPIPGENQVRNNAGGYGYDIGPWAQLDRFLILGSEGGSFYATERKLTVQNAQAALACIKADGQRVVARVVEISDAGRAPKNDPAIFVLALAAAEGDEATRRDAFAAVPQVCRIGTHLFHFAEAVQNLRGWGRGLRDAVANWYLNRDPLKLATQLLKYQQRDGWSHRDLLRLAHPKPETPTQNALFGYVVKQGKVPFASEAPEVNEFVGAFEALHGKHYESVGHAASIIVDHNLTHEMIPTELKREPLIWEALLQQMPMTALVRNLSNLSKHNLDKGGDSLALILQKLTDEEQVKRSRIHPLQLLIALRQYAAGQQSSATASYRVQSGKDLATWVPNGKVVDALNAAFYLAFANAPKTGQRILQGLDVSGSMGSPVLGQPNLTARDATAALSLVTTATEDSVLTVAFTAANGRNFGGWDPRNNAVAPFPVSASQRLDDVIARMTNVPFGATDCALPMLYALEKGLEIDTFVIYTDNESWAGPVHVKQALERYRQRTGIPAKLAVVAMTATNYSVADPKDPNQLDIVGFDAAIPAILAEFMRGFGRAPEAR